MCLIKFIRKILGMGHYTDQQTRDITVKLDTIFKHILKTRGTNLVRMVDSTVDKVVYEMDLHNGHTISLSIENVGGTRLEIHFIQTTMINLDEISSVCTKISNLFDYFKSDILVLFEGVKGRT